MIPINEKGRLPEQLPLFRGHTAVVLDTDWYGQTSTRGDGCLSYFTGVLSMIH